MKIAVDLYNVYKTYFREPYTVNNSPVVASLPDYGTLPPKVKAGTTFKGESLTAASPDIYGREIFLPVEFWKNNQLFLTINCCTVRVSSKKTIIRTMVSERMGEVQEQFNIGNYIFNIKGVLIGENRQFPDEKIKKLRELYETTDEVEIYNALTGLFMDKSYRVTVDEPEWQEVEGSDIYHRPFSLRCETDFVDSLIVEN